MISVREQYLANLERREKAITFHLSRLRDLATRCSVILELGVGEALSSSAFLDGLPASGHLVSYDVKITRAATRLSNAAKTKWTLCRGASQEAAIVDPDLLFVDSAHTYLQVRAELDRHADSCSRKIVFHDTVTFGTVAAVGETGRHAWNPGPGRPVADEQRLGIRQAVDELMLRDRSWFIESHDWRSHGLLVLERRR